MRKTAEVEGPVAVQKAVKNKEFGTTRCENVKREKHDFLNLQNIENKWDHTKKII